MQMTHELAQPIVDRAIAILHRNVNLMNEAGIIVGSGDLTRVGSFHAAAAHAVAANRSIEVRPEEAEQWPGVRPGVNLPVRLGERVVGVVGITGNPTEVRPFGELIREMVQLLLAQVRSAELERTAFLAREALLRQVLTGRGELPARMAREADVLGLDFSRHYRVLICDPQTELSISTDELEEAARRAGFAPVLAAGPWEGRLLLLAGEPETGARLEALGRELSGACVVAAGRTRQGLAGIRQSYRSAQSVLLAGRRLGRTGLLRTRDLTLEVLLVALPQEQAAEYVRQVLGRLPPSDSEQGAALRRTIRLFAESGLSFSGAAAALGVHRHTLPHRLDRVLELTGLDPRSWDGCMRLSLALLAEQLGGQSVEASGGK